MATTIQIEKTIKRGLKLKETPRIFQSENKAKEVLRRAGSFLLQLPTDMYVVCKSEATCDRLSVTADAVLLYVSENGKIYEV